jgi:hypothetical protein
VRIGLHLANGSRGVSGRILPDAVANIELREIVRRGMVRRSFARLMPHHPLSASIMTRLAKSRFHTPPDYLSIRNKRLRIGLDSCA